MRIFYVLIILLAVYAISAFLRFSYILATAHLPVITQRDEIMGNGPTLVYVAAGDSTAAGVGASLTEHSYSYRLAHFFSHGHTVSYHNVGVSGAKTQDVISEQLATIVNLNPDIVTVSIGANDITHGYSPDSVAANIRLITETLVKQTHAQIYITDIPILDRSPLIPYPLQKILAYKIRKTNPQILALESDWVHVVDIHEFGWGDYSNVAVTFAADQFHPNDEGYSNWARAFIAKMKFQYPLLDKIDTKH